MGKPHHHSTGSLGQITVPEVAEEVLPPEIVHSLLHIQVVEVKGRRVVDLRLRVSARGLVAFGIAAGGVITWGVKFIADHWLLIQDFVQRI